MAKIQTCTTCNGTTFHTRDVERQRDVAGHRFTASLPAEVCATCGAAFFRSSDLGRFDRAAAHALLEAGEAGPEAVRFLRNSVPLQARELADLLDVRPETVSRWENGKRPIDRASYATLRQLVEESARRERPTLDYLRALRKPRKLAKRVRLDVGRGAA